jgi:hypothetical protein
MVRLSYELSVVFDHNPIIEIGYRYELFKVGLRPPDPILPRFSSSVCCGHSKIVLQVPESLECCAVPFRQAGLGFIGCLEEIEENIVR